MIELLVLFFYIIFDILDSSENKNRSEGFDENVFHYIS